MLLFVCECDVVKDTGKEEYVRPFIHIGLDWSWKILSLLDSLIPKFAVKWLL